MEWEIVRKIFAWSAVLNLGILLWWYGFIILAHDWTYKLHSRFFPISRDQFDAFHYQGMMWFKLMLFFFNIVPYLAMRIVF